MKILNEIDWRDGSSPALVSWILEQQAQLADNQINQALMRELVSQFVASEKKLEQAHASVLAMSRTDALTGIANRRWFDECLTQELARSLRSETPIGLLLLDIDCFKLYNDNYGHAAGDECLIKVAQTVDRIVKRPPDMAARYGGEELVCILPGTDIAGVDAVGTMVLEGIRALALPHAHSKATNIVTVSIGGVSMVPDHALTSKGLIEAADALLYQSKENGRNRLTVGERAGRPA